jgi:hypothetical protein
MEIALSAGTANDLPLNAQTIARQGAGREISSIDCIKRFPYLRESRGRPLQAGYRNRRLNAAA